MKVEAHLKLITIFGKKEMSWSVEADNKEDALEVIKKAIDGMSI